MSFRLLTFDFPACHRLSAQNNERCAVAGRRLLTRAKRGFTMVELLVTMAIFLVITGVVLANYKTYGNNAYFANASEDIVLALRQAQVYGVGAKGESGSFTSAYGAYFTTGNQIKIFRDSNSDNKYTTGEEIETITLKSPITISYLGCQVFITSSPPPCGGPQLSVTFKRPNPDAIIRDNTVSTSLIVATIALSNGISGAGAKTSTTTIMSSGQISLK